MQIGGKCLTLVEGTVYNFVSFMSFFENNSFFAMIFSSLNTELKVCHCKNEPLPLKSMIFPIFEWFLVFESPCIT